MRPDRRVHDIFTKLSTTKKTVFTDQHTTRRVCLFRFAVAKLLLLPTVIFDAFVLVSAPDRRVRGDRAAIVIGVGR